MLRGTCYYNKKIKVENVAESAKNLSKCSEVSGLWPFSVECSLMKGRRVAWSFFQVRTRTYDLELSRTFSERRFFVKNVLNLRSGVLFLRRGAKRYA